MTVIVITVVKYSNITVKKQPPPPKARKDNVNIVFIGHVDAGKSTIGGHILYLTGQVRSVAIVVVRGR